MNWLTRLKLWIVNGSLAAYHVAEQTTLLAQQATTIADLTQRCADDEAAQAATQARLRFFNTCTMPPQGVVDLARILVQQWAGVDATGEFKRHRVYGTLQHEFPTVPKKQLALAIELVNNGG